MINFLVPVMIATGCLLDEPSPSQILSRGTRAEALQAAEARFKQIPSDEHRALVGMAQILAAIERAGQSVVNAGVANRFHEFSADARNRRIERAAERLEEKRRVLEEQKRQFARQPTGLYPGAGSNIDPKPTKFSEIDVGESENLKPLMQREVLDAKTIKESEAWLAEEASHLHSLQQDKSGLEMNGWKPFIVKNPTKVNRDVIDGWLAKSVDDLKQAEATLSKVNTAGFSLKLRISELQKIGFDFNSDGKIESAEQVFAIIQSSSPQRSVRSATNTERVQVSRSADHLHADLGDVYWLRGYCHLINGVLVAVRGLDGKELIDATGHKLFPNLDTPYKGVFEHAANHDPFDISEMLDSYLAFYLMLKLPVYRPEKMNEALSHFEQSLACTEQAFKLYANETDDSFEWIPNPKQKSCVVQNLSAEKFQVWQETLAEAKQVLAGKKLVPHLRIASGKAINIRRVFTEPGKTFEPILWFHGLAAIPYLEKGPTTDTKFWSRMNSLLSDGDFGLAGYLLWFN